MHLNINFRTGAGFSSRFQLWNQGLILTSNSPFFGYGFGADKVMYIKMFDGGMSYNILLHYAIELV